MAKTARTPAKHKAPPPSVGVWRRRLTGVSAAGAVLAGFWCLMLSSLIPAWRATRNTDMSSTLRQGIDVAGRSRVWGRNGLVAGQVALALVVLTVTVSLFRAFQIEVSQPGFRTERMVLSTFDPQLARYSDEQADAFLRRMSLPAA